MFVPDFQNKVTPNVEQVLEQPNGISLLLSNNYTDELGENLLEKISEFVHVKLAGKM